MNYRKCLDDALLLVEETESELPSIRKLYEESLADQSINPKLLIKTKSVLEHLRSALDFIAQGLVLKYAPMNDKKTFFPYAKLETDKEKFMNGNKIGKAIPGLSEHRPDLVDLILSMQHFSQDGMRWFPEFMELNNKNKHVHLVPHGLVKGVCLSIGGNYIFAKSIRLGKNGVINTDQGTINGPLTITPENVDKFDGYGIAAAEQWENIYIDGYGFPLNSFEFIRHCVQSLAEAVRIFNKKVP